MSAQKRTCVSEEEESAPEVNPMAPQKKKRQAKPSSRAKTKVAVYPAPRSAASSRPASSSYPSPNVRITHTVHDPAIGSPFRALSPLPDVNTPVDPFNPTLYTPRHNPPHIPNPNLISSQPANVHATYDTHNPSTYAVNTSPANSMPVHAVNAYTVHTPPSQSINPLPNQIVHSRYVHPVDIPTARTNIPVNGPTEISTPQYPTLLSTPQHPPPDHHDPTGRLPSLPTPQRPRPDHRGPAGGPTLFLAPQHQYPNHHDPTGGLSLSTPQDPHADHRDPTGEPTSFSAPQHPHPGHHDPTGRPPSLSTPQHPHPDHRGPAGGPTSFSAPQHPHLDHRDPAIRSTSFPMPQHPHPDHHDSIGLLPTDPRAKLPPHTPATPTSLDSRLNPQPMTHSEPPPYSQPSPAYQQSPPIPSHNSNSWAQRPSQFRDASTHPPAPARAPPPSVNDRVRPTPGSAKSPAQPEVIDIEDNQSDVEEGEISDEHEDEFGTLSDTPTARPGIRFSSLRTDVPGDRRSKNCLQNPPGGNCEGVAMTEPASSLPGSSSKIKLRDYKKIFEWKALIGLAQDYLLGYILLHNAFPSPGYLKSIATECLSEAQSEFPRLYPEFPLDSGLVSKHRPRIVEILAAQVATLRGHIRDFACHMVEVNIKLEVNRTPPVLYRSAESGDVLTSHERPKVITARYVQQLLTDFQFLDTHLSDSKIPFTTNRLNSVILGTIITHIYQTDVWQAALLASPSKEQVDRFLKNPGDPSVHWSGGAPPPFIAFAGTILSVCLDEWKTGFFEAITLNPLTHDATYSDILDFVKKQWYNKDIGEYVRSRFRFSEMTSRLLNSDKK